MRGARYGVSAEEWVVRTCGLVSLVGIVFVVIISGCVTAPERIEVNVGSRPPPVDSSRVPHPATLEEAQQELDKAYQNLQHLEQDNAKLKRKAEDAKRERDEYKQRLKKYEKD